MANQEHLDILTQGVEAWNKWRREHPDQLLRPDLNGADLTQSNLARIGWSTDLRKVNLYGANLQGTNLHLANLHSADLMEADLTGADLREADLRFTNLNLTNLSKANLAGASLWFANLNITTLAQADLTGADFRYAHFNRANLSGANFSNVHLSNTVFGNVDLSTVKGLETVEHRAPSTIGIDTIINSQGNIPEIFLRQAGVPDSIIEAIPALVGSLKPIEFYSCFISYSSKDQSFAERLYTDLQSNGVRCWFTPEHMKIGDKLRPRIEESIQLYDKLLLVLSEYSITSNWVAYEVERALNKEPEGIPNVLFPIRLDDTVMQLKVGWANDIRRTRHIGDFTHWKNYDNYQRAFKQLLHALKAGA